MPEMNNKVKELINQIRSVEDFDSLYQLKLYIDARVKAREAFEEYIAFETQAVVPMKSFLYNPDISHIENVKLYRQVYGVGLAESKRACDILKSMLNVENKETKP